MTDPVGAMTKNLPAGVADRFGGTSGGRWKRLRKVAAAEASPPPSTPAGILSAVRVDGAPRLRWAVVMPSGVTAYTVELWRWVGVYTDDGTAVVAAAPVLDRQVVGMTRSACFVQEVDNDLVELRITAITGTPGSNFQVLYKPVRPTSKEL